jgi:predicted nuclease of restriction endonuclease-like RecB superfamily
VGVVAKGTRQKTGERSAFEKEVGRQLGSRAKHEEEQLEYEVWEVRTYTPDFVLEWKGHKRYIEAKGYFSARDRKKLLLVRDQFPGIDLRIVFQRNNKLSRKSKTRYSDWAERHGFTYAIGSVPKEWRKRNG